MPDLDVWVPTLATGFWVTLQLAAISCVLAFAIAGIVAVVSIAPSPAVRAIGRGYVDVFRSIPILAFLFLLYYGLGPIAAKLHISAFWIAVGALSIIEAAYLAEVFRAALLSIRSTQWDAGASLGLGWFATLRAVVIPQALPAALPGATNMLIVIIKDTSLASLVAVNEVTLVASGLVGVYFQPLPVFAMVGLFFLLLVVPLTIVASRVERFSARAMGIR